MNLFLSGIQLTETEHLSLLHLVPDPEQWLRDVVADKANARKTALINEWRPKLFADPSVTSLPADQDALAALIMARLDYKDRSQQDSEQIPPVLPSLHNIGKYNSVVRAGPDVVTLFPAGIFLSDFDASLILAYVQDLDDWVLGALLGDINRGKKKMIRQFLPVLMDDPNVPTFPGGDDALIELIVNHSSYRTLPEQASDRAQASARAFARPRLS